MSRPLSNRERFLVLLVGGSVLIVINLFLFDFFFKNRTDLANQLARKSSQLRSLQALLSSGPLWEQRETWLTAKQPRMENEATAGVQFLNQLQEAAKRESVSIEQPVIGSVESHPGYTTVSVSFETKSTWKALVTYLTGLQGPERFVVVESVDLKVDTNDATQMHGVFKISKWFAAK